MGRKQPIRKRKHLHLRNRTRFIKSLDRLKDMKLRGCICLNNKVIYVGVKNYYKKHEIFQKLKSFTPTFTDYMRENNG